MYTALFVITYNICRIHVYMLSIYYKYNIYIYIYIYILLKGVIVSISNTASIITLVLPKSDNKIK